MLAPAKFGLGWPDYCYTMLKKMCIVHWKWHRISLSLEASRARESKAGVNFLIWKTKDMCLITQYILLTTEMLHQLQVTTKPQLNISVGSSNVLFFPSHMNSISGLTKFLPNMLKYHCLQGTAFVLSSSRPNTAPQANAHRRVGSPAPGSSSTGELPLT